MVLKGVPLGARPGEVVGLVGLNGSGKSTLVKCLAGVVSPDVPTVASVNGEQFALGDAPQAYAAGLRFVHQDLGLIGTLTIWENIGLVWGFPRNRVRLLSRRRAQAKAREACRSLGYEQLDVNSEVRDLSVIERTEVAIARATMDGGARVVAFDEPTASMSLGERERFYQTIEELRRQQVGVVLVSHDLQEVLRLTDRVVVLRDGVLVADAPSASASPESLVGAMTGAAAPHTGAPVLPVGEVRPDLGGGPELGVSAGELVLEAKNISVSPVRDASVVVRAGEILGIAGVEGSGRDQLVEALAGIRRCQGTILVRGKRIPPGRPDLAVRNGLVAVPGDRLGQAAFTESSARRNISSGLLGRDRSKALLGRRAERTQAETWIRRLNIKGHAESAMRELSGGNQQKCVLARSFLAQPVVLALVQPTQGVDVEARRIIHAGIRKARGLGGVVVASSDSTELAALCDRVLVLRDGEVVEEMTGRSVRPEAIDASCVA